MSPSAWNGVIAVVNTDIYVIGGEPAGLAAAIATRLRGFNVTVADGIVSPVDKACAEGLMPDALAALSKLGVFVGVANSVPFSGHSLPRSRHCGRGDFPTGCGRGVRRTTLHRDGADI